MKKIFYILLAVEILNMFLIGWLYWRDRFERQIIDNQGQVLIRVVDTINQAIENSKNEGAD